MELCTLIVDTLARECSTAHNNLIAHHGDPDPATKRTLALCALVCRAWAPICQRAIFHCITLRSEEDFRELLSFVNREGCALGLYVGHLCLNVTFGNTPWLHMLCRRICPPWDVRAITRMSDSALKASMPFPGLSSTSLSLHGPAGLSIILSDIHSSLPRRVPSAFSRGIVELCLADMTLHSVADVLRILKDLPSIAYLSCLDIEWEVPLCRKPDLSDLRNTISHVRSIRNRSVTPSQGVKNCAIRGDDSHWAALLMVGMMRGYIPVDVHDGDFRGMCNIAKTITNGAGEAWDGHRVQVLAGLYNGIDTGKRF